MKSFDVEVLAPRRVEAHQYFREWFADACARAGFHQHMDLPLPWNVKVAIGKLGLCFPFVRGSRLLVLSGGRPEYFAWPWCYGHEIIPVVWDCWPKYWEHLARFVKRNRVRTVFCMSSQTADHVRRECPGVDAVWLPEGIDITLYPKGPNLVCRTIDVLEMGRVLKRVHEDIIRHDFGSGIRHLFPKDGLVFPDFQALTRGMRETKIAICYPRCDTHPEMAGSIETMTQRYWEFMLSGAVMAGRAPRELIDFCGYNPVVELGENPAEEIDNILRHIGDYQDLVDRNRLFAEEHGSWDARMSIILEHLR